MTKHNEKLTAERVRFLFDYNPTTGDLRWRNPTSHRLAAGERAGTLGANGRLYIGVDEVRHLAHRIAWLYVHGTLPEENIAAKNGDYADLRIANYRPQSYVETARKNPLRSTNTSGIRGVIWDKAKNKWRAEITRDYQKIHLGHFDIKEDAQAAYFKACQSETRSADPEVRRQQAARKLVESKMRRLWKRTLRENGGVVGWQAYQQFADEVRPQITATAIVVPANKDTPIGPQNYIWIEKATTTRAALSPAERNARDRLHRQQNPDIYKNQELKRAFGITLVDYNAMLDAQGGLCAICKQPEVEIRKGKLQALGVDHCHTTGAVRDLLCTACNSGIARFKDNPNLLRAAADYIEHHAAKAKSASVPASNVVPLKRKGATGTS